MKINNLKSVTDNLGKYTFSRNESDYITVTEWSNGEGYDIDLNGKLIQLLDTELEAINYLTRVLLYEKKD